MKRASTMRRTTASESRRRTVQVKLRLLPETAALLYDLAADRHEDMSAIVTALIRREAGVQ